MWVYFERRQKCQLGMLGALTWSGWCTLMHAQLWLCWAGVGDTSRAPDDGGCWWLFLPRITRTFFCLCGCTSATTHTSTLLMEGTKHVWRPCVEHLMAVVVTTMPVCFCCVMACALWSRTTIVWHDRQLFLEGIDDDLSWLCVSSSRTPFRGSVVVLEMDAAVRHSLVLEWLDWADEKSLMATLKLTTTVTRRTEKF